MCCQLDMTFIPREKQIVFCYFHETRIVEITKYNLLLERYKSHVTHVQLTTHSITDLLLLSSISDRLGLAAATVR